MRTCSIAGALFVASIMGACATPAVYQSAPLPGFLMDVVTQSSSEPRSQAPPVSAANDTSITLPDAVRECVLNNLRLRSGEEQIRLVQADYITESLIPNCQFMADAQLLPITPLSIVNQGGPPQYDAYLTVPIDWFLFGKRVAARAAAQVNIDTAQAAFADQTRQEIAQTVHSFYDVLEADATVKAIEQTLTELQEIETTAQERERLGGAANESRRVRLAVLDMQRDLRKWRAAAKTTRAKLDVLLGRPPGSPDYEVRGTLAVRAVAPLLSIDEAWALAEQNRPDLIAAHRAIVAADAATQREHRRAYPNVSVMAGADYQDQVAITGFRNPWLWTVAVSTTLPITDRNQGHVLAAEATARQARAALELAREQAREEVEQALAEYGEAMNGVTAEDIASLRTAEEIRDAAHEAYRKGDRDLLAILDAERAYRDRVRNTLANLTDYWQALNHVNAAVGLRVLSAQEGDVEDIPRPNADERNHPP